MGHGSLGLGEANSPILGREGERNGRERGGGVGVREEGRNWVGMGIYLEGYDRRIRSTNPSSCMLCFTENFHK